LVEINEPEELSYKDLAKGERKEDNMKN